MANTTNHAHDKNGNNFPNSLQVFRLQDLIKPLDLWVFALLLGLVTVVSVIGLLMVSGWFLSATALAGMLAVGSHSFNYLMPAAIIRVMAIARTAGRYGELMVSHHAIFSLLKVLRLRFFNALAQKPLANQYHTLSSSHQMHRLVSDINLLNEFNLRVVLPWIVAVLVVLALGFGLLLFSSASVIITIGIGLLLLLLLLIPAVMSQRGIAQATEVAHVTEERRNALLAPLTIITQLLLWRQWQTQTAGFIAHDKQLQQQQWSAQKQRSFTMFAMQMSIYGIIFLVLLSIAQFFTPIASINNTTDLIITPKDIAPDIPYILAIVLGMLGLMEVILPLGQHYLSFGNSLAAKKRLNELLTPQSTQPAQLKQAEQSREQTHLQNKPLLSMPVPAPLSSLSSKTSQTFDTAQKSYALQTLQPKLTLKLTNVSCKLPNALVGATNVNATINAGTPLIVTGASGCGKSTLLQTLAGELAPQAGSITLNGHSWYDYDWADQLGYLGQQLDIFDQTLADNLRLGKANATDAELIDVLKKVALFDWVQQQPQGLDTHLGEYGTGVSGGQARRIALARLLLKPRSVLLLDEPFAGLDKHTRQFIWDTVLTHQQHAILIMVSHHHSQQHQALNSHNSKITNTAIAGKQVDWLKL